jgi:antitoxin YefM
MRKMTMSSIRISEDIVPIGEFRNRTAHWLRHAVDSGHPVILTQNGRPAGVLLSPVAYDRLTEKERFLDSVAAGWEDSEAGHLLSADQVRADLATRRAAQKPS